MALKIDEEACIGCESVSYTHLDVYKRQVPSPTVKTAPSKEGNC